MNRPITAAERDQQIKAFVAQCGIEGEIAHCAQDMSDRVYYRVYGAQKNYIVMDSLNTTMFEQFKAVSHLLQRLSVRAPKVFASNMEAGFMLLEDFGDNTFTKLLVHNPTYEMALYQTAITVLKALHTQTEQPPFLDPYSHQHLLKEVEVFIDWYWPFAKNNKAPDMLKQEFLTLWQNCFSNMPNTPQSIVLRDYHCDNLMFITHEQSASEMHNNLCVDTCGVLDFQDALWGSVAYDFVSLLEDARRDVSPDVIAACSQLFFKDFDAATVGAIQATGMVLSAARHVKILGVFSRYALRAGNLSKCVHHPRIWGYLDVLCQQESLSEIAKWFAVHFPSPQMRR